MAAFGLLLLLSAAAVASGQLQQVEQERLDLRPPNIKQVLQQEQDLEVPPDILVGGAMGAPRSPPLWGSALDGFPPAWPVADAVTRHCRDPPTLPPPLLLPPNAFAHLRRQAAALAALRPRLNDCCRQHSPLPCARRAWTDVLDGFCTDEFGVKTRQFHCCHRHGAARRRCFAQETPAPTWDPSATWDPNVAWDLVTEPPFPPGEPTAANLGNICGLRALRPGAPGPGGRSGPRVRLRVRLEHEYGRCCRNESLSCAHSAWLKGLNRFCREEASVKTGQHRCCQRRGARDRGRCFAAAAPHPEYDRELHNVSLARPGPALLRSLCGPTRLFTQRRPVPELLGAVTAACCPLPPQERGPCAREQLSQGIATLCATPLDAWRDPQGCCSWEEPERRRCFDNTYLSQVTLGAAVPPPPPGDEE
ncbi:PREDICTED: extracellular matrix protein 1 [Pseudopodoces humilis]|uniref:extracellular matrix protein 1 n=1 Tax=Pseudopodoces humilis TaxID=181119 RepID=UPI0006B8133A|nr:PREDICTED: extracellular matrix protein 1 [Pseudopodoces humilis]